MDGPRTVAAFRPCAVIPTFDNPATIRAVVENARVHVPVLVIDDGSAEPGRRATEELAREGLAQVHHRARNGGKGAAVRTGLHLARELGYTHALQIDADGQHDTADIERFLAAARAEPSALVLGAPVYDASAPLVRILGRKLTRGLTNAQTFVGPQNVSAGARRKGWGETIHDPMCGFRVYPLETTCKVADRCGARMDFDIEIAVRVAWEGVPVVNLPTKVRYLEGGVSHFRMVRDNLRITWAHSRLLGEGLLRAVVARAGRKH